ncbi:heavy metal translocating P-type ATPase [Nocardiopsis tropica]|uniref:heavy metal translocating P-type ATPase n=1 Tax=Nocardiopsis tropica TaxID=109330 RepID=UPI0031D26052
MTPPRAPAVVQDRVLPRPPSVLATGLKLPEVRWALAALALFLLGWGLQLSGAPAPLWWSLYLACYATGGWEPALAGLRALREKTLDVDLLMIVAAIAAASIGQVFDGALLIVIFATSGALEVVVTQRTADSVDSLLNLAPEQATLLHGDGTTTTVASRDLEPGERILVRPGERIGGDGTVVDGTSEVDQQAITGESVPVVRGVGDEVLSGTVNGTGTLTVQVTRPASASVIARIVTLVEEASETKARTQLFIEKVEQTYSFGVVVATLLVLAVPMLLFGHAFEDALLRAIVFMIVASPCAVVLSTMPPLLASIANAGRHGVLVKSATVMEGIGRTSVVAFDKTGTLTEGAPEVTDIGPVADHGADTVLALAAAVEHYSEHPLGRAIVRAAAERGLPLQEVTGFRALPGLGVVGCVDGSTVTVERGAADSSTTGTLVQVRRDESLIGTITLMDRLRPDAPAAVRAAADLIGAPAVLLTGDNPAAAATVAERTGIGTVHASLLPQDKVALVTDMEARGERVLLVGDGVNDAPALAAASTGAAMGRRGSDLALDTADVIIVRDELGSVANLVRLSRRARRYVIANLAVAATVITVLVTWDLVATLPLALAVAGHEGSTVLVALNGARLLRRSAWEA